MDSFSRKAGKFNLAFSKKKIWASPLILLSLSCCMVGPNYHRPSAVISAKFKEVAPPPGWGRARPDLAKLPKGQWWLVFDDLTLSQLEESVEKSNQSLKEYDAQFRKAAAEINAVRATLYPSLSGSLTFNRAGAAHSATNTWTTGPSASWTLDVWGKIRRQVEEQVTTAQADAALYASMRLSYQTQLAEYYFELRYQDSLIDLYSHNVKLYRGNLRILQNQLDAGVSDPASVYQAQYLLQNTEASLEDAQINRAKYEHAIAVLIGKPPAEVTLAHTPLPEDTPPPPVVVPSVLLERRPDVSEAERNMESANAEIGYAIGAFFPEISLSGSYGYSGDPLSQLVQIATRTWSLGGSATETIFSGGARTAAVREAEADYDNAVATYRQTILTAMQDIEDQLASLNHLSKELKNENKAIASAQNAVRVSTNEYLAGTTIYTTVITAQQNALTYEQQQLSIRENQLLSEVQLLTDIGGGWISNDIPSKDELQKDNPVIPSFISPDRNGVSSLLK